MGVGGNTWDAAGILELGTGNTFDTDDADLIGPHDLVEEGWWKFTTTGLVVVTITSGEAGVRVNAYTGTTGARIEASYIDHTHGTAKFIAEADVEYHVVAGQSSALGIPSYTLARVDTTSGITYSPWTDELRTLDNTLVISAAHDFSGELMGLNPASFDTVDNTTDWFFEVVETMGMGDRTNLGPPQRVGLYEITEVIGGTNIDDDPEAAGDCAWTHVEIGHRGEDNAWDNACGAIPPNLSVADTSGPEIQPFYILEYVARDGLIAAARVSAELHQVARGAWFLPVRDNLRPYGMLDLSSDVNPIRDALLPEGYTGPVLIEWEDPYVELVAVHVTGDRVVRSDPDPIGTTFHVNMDLDKLPVYSGTEWSRHWQTGLLGVEMPSPSPTRKVRFTYLDGDPTWSHLDAIVDWTDCASFPNENPDAIIGMELALTSRPALNTSATGDSDVAFKFTLRAPRFRVRYYDSTTTSPPRRIFGRTDALTHGAARVLGDGNTVQTGVRAGTSGGGVL